jgi:hypothetical protein
MATPPDFSVGQVLTAANMNAVGLWLVKTVTVGTGVSSIPVTGAFSADYDSYKVIYDGGVASAFSTIAMTLGGNNGDYNMSLPYVTYGSATPLGTSLLNATSFALIGAGNTNYLGLDVDVLSPNLARFTRVQGHYIADAESGSYSGVHKVATAYTDFALSIVGGTATGGTVRVYGYRK